MPTNTDRDEPAAPETDDGTADRPSWAHQLFGPPIEAARRFWRALIERLARALGATSGFWRFLWLGPEPDEAGDLTPPAHTAWLFATCLLALVCYGWPLWRWLPAWLFIPLAFVVFWLVKRAIEYASLRGSGHWMEEWLRATDPGTGLIWWERLGFLLGLAGSVLAVAIQPILLPLALCATAGFAALLAQDHPSRELRRVRELPPLPPVTPDSPDKDKDENAARGYVGRTFDWTVRHAVRVDSHELTLLIHEPTYERFRDSNPGPRFEGEEPLFADFIVDGTTSDIERASAELHAIGESNGYSTYEEITLALAFVQAIKYSLDSESKGRTEYWRYPVETLYDQTGDCEDSTILAAALLRRLGHRVATLMPPEHAALAVEAPPGTPGEFFEFKGHRMYYCETTASGWAVGEVPRDYQGLEIPAFAVPPFEPQP